MAACGHIEFYWADHYGSYAEAKACGGVRIIHHDYLDEATGFDRGIACDIRELIETGATCVDGGAKLCFFLFGVDGKLIDAR
jgi:hypothetical protein